MCSKNILDDEKLLFQSLSNINGKCLANYILDIYTSHKNNCLNSREMSVFARYKSQKSIKSKSSTCENCELRVKKFRLLGIGSVIFRYYASIVLIYFVLYSLKPFFSKRLCIQLSKRR